MVCPATTLLTTSAQAATQGAQIRGLMGVDGGRHADQDRVGLGQRVRFGGQPQRVGTQVVGQPGPIAGQQVHLVALDVGKPVLAHVVADDVGTVVGQAERGGQAHIAQADDGDVLVYECQRHSTAPIQLPCSVCAPTAHTGGSAVGAIDLPPALAVGVHQVRLDFVVHVDTVGDDGRGVARQF